jgi:hypothetical protein
MSGSPLYAMAPLTTIMSATAASILYSGHSASA